MKLFCTILPAGISGGTVVAIQVVSATIPVQSVKEWAIVTVTICGGIGTVLATVWNWRVSRAKEHATKSLDEVNHLQAQSLKNRLCFECRAGRVPALCPISPAERPVDCPHRIKG